MPKTVELKLHCDLSEDELRARGQKLAEALREIRRVEDAKRDAMKDFKEQLEELHGETRETADAIRNKSEFRLVSCQVFFHAPVVGSKRTIRMDTGELVREEAMTLDEQQMNLYASEELPLKT
jgi:hypothetical protein